MAQTISVRIDKSEVDEISRISKIEKKNKSSILREVLDRGIKEKKLDIAIEKYRKNEATAWSAARIAGMPLSKFMDVLVNNKIDAHYGMKELEEDLEISL